MTKLPTIRGVNLLYLIATGVTLVIGSILQALSATWGLLATEFLLILPVAILFLVVTRLPIRETMRLRWPGAVPAGLCAVIGVGALLLAVWWGNLLVQLFGYSFSVGPDLYPRSLGQALLVFFAMAVSAPLCEEPLFRGVIQRGYERRGPWTAIWVTAVLFSIFHMSFQRTLAVLPVALVLGYAAWRSRSLVASILIHFVYNGLAALIHISTSLDPSLNFGLLGSLPLALAGVVLILGGMALLNRATPPHPAEEPIPEQSSWISRAWPVALATSVIFFFSFFELVIGRFPAVFATDRLTLAEAPWQGNERWEYELRNVLDEPVGRAGCSLSAEDRVYLLNCLVHQEAFEAKTGSSFFKTGAYDRMLSAQWDRANNLHLAGASISQTGEDFNQVTRVSPSGTGLRLEVSAGNGTAPETLPVQADALLMEEWPWRLSALPLQLASSQQVSLAWPSLWSEETQASRPAVKDEVATVRGAEPLSVPAGDFIAWRVTLGKFTAWYDVDAPHTLLKYDNDFVTYVLVESSEEQAQLLTR